LGDRLGDLLQRVALLDRELADGRPAKARQMGANT
jgi:hypothetical protein